MTLTWFAPLLTLDGVVLIHDDLVNLLPVSVDEYV